MHIHELLGHFRRESAALLAELGRRPTDEELCARLGVTPAKLALLTRSVQEALSLETPIGKEKNDAEPSTLQKLIAASDVRRCRRRPAPRPRAAPRVRARAAYC